MWIAREQNGLLRLYTKEPVRNNGCWYMEDNASMCYAIEPSLFPDLTWEFEPVEIEIIPKQYLSLLEEIQNSYEDLKEKVDCLESEHTKELEEEDSNHKENETKKEANKYYLGFAKFNIGDKVLIMPSNIDGIIDDILYDKRYYYRVTDDKGENGSWIVEDDLCICDRNGHNHTLKIGDKVYCKELNIFGKITGYLPKYAGGSFEVETENKHTYILTEKSLTHVDIKEPKYRPLDRVRTVSGYIGTIIKVYPFYQYDVTKTKYNYDVKLDDSGTFLFNEYELSLYTEPEKEKLMPFEKVLVRNTSDEVWQANLFNRYICLDNKYVTIDGHQWSYCVPYDGNEKLHNTTHNYDK